MWSVPVVALRTLYLRAALALERCEYTVGLLQLEKDVLNCCCILVLSKLLSCVGWMFSTGTPYFPTVSVADIADSLAQMFEYCCNTHTFESLF